MTTTCVVYQVTLPDLPSEWHTGTVLVFGQDPTMHEEAFRVSVGAPDVAGNYTPVHAVGGGELGCVYAVYHVSQALLGVDPWTHYLDIVPQYSGSVSLAGDYAYASGAPAFAVGPSCARRCVSARVSSYSPSVHRGAGARGGASVPAHHVACVRYGAGSPTTKI